MSHILLIEDDLDAASELEELINNQGYNTLCANSVRQAIGLLNEHSDIGVILTDLRMPDESGLRLIQRLHEHPQWRNIPILVTSGHADRYDVIQLLRMGVKDFLPKPIHYEYLLQVLASL